MATLKRRRAKRPNGAGSTTFEKGKGLWKARATVVDAETGQSLRKTWYAPSEREAREKMDAAVSEYRRGAPVGTGREVTLGAWCVEWLAALQVRPKTRVRYEECLAHALAAFGDRPLSKITPTAVSGLVRQLHREGGPATRNGGPLKSRGANRVRDVLRNCLQEAVRQGKLSRNPAALARPVPEDDVEEMRILDPANVVAFLEMAEREPDGNLWITALATGARLGELQGARDEDVVDGVLRIRRELSRVKGEWLIQPPKTRRGRRDIRLPAVALEALQRERARQAEARLASPGWPTEWQGYLFLAEAGVPRNPSTVSYRMKAAMRKAGLDPIRFHDTRHTAGSFLEAAGVPIAEISKALGHSRVSTTHDFYSHAVNKTGSRVSAAMDQLLTGTTR
jgi:integrase